MIYALWWMSKTRNNVNGYRVTSRMYAATRALFIKNSPSRDAATKLKFINNYKAGLYKYDYKKVSHSMKLYIKTLSKDALRQRMKNSVQTCNQIKRADAIRKGKASKFLLVTTDKKTNGDAYIKQHKVGISVKTGKTGTINWDNPGLNRLIDLSGVDLQQHTIPHKELTNELGTGSSHKLYKELRDKDQAKAVAQPLHPDLPIIFVKLLK